MTKELKNAGSQSNNEKANEKECLMLFGMNILEKKPHESMKRSCSMGNWNSCEVGNEEAEYLSHGPCHNRRQSASREKSKKGIRWSEEEHRVFLAGLRELGKGDWKGISRKFVRTRTPTQVGSHAQKFFLRIAANDTRKRKHSLFDMPLLSEDQEFSHKDSLVSTMKKTAETLSEPSISQDIKLVAKDKQQCSSQTNQVVNQFPQSITAAFGPFPMHHGMHCAARPSGNMPFPVQPHSANFHGNLDYNFPIFSNVSSSPWGHHALISSTDNQKDGLDLEIGLPLQPTKKTKQQTQGFGAINVS